VKFTGFSRRSFSLAWFWILTSFVAHAGSGNQVFVPLDNNPSSNLDDVAQVINLQWPAGTEPQFFYTADGGEFLSLKDNLFPFNDPMDVLRCLSDAINTWNGAQFSHFKFNGGLMPAASLQRPIMNSNGTVTYGPVLGGQLDGFNVISDNVSIPDATVSATTRISFFMRDFNLKSMFTGDGVPLDMLGMIVTSSVGTATGTTGATNGTLGISFNADGNVDLWLPLKDFKQGEIIDADIMFNSQVEDFRAWPANPSDVVVPPGQISPVIGSKDIQAIMMHELGWVAGLGNSAIYDSVMYPYINPQNFAYPTDPYKRRKLSFDDEMTAAIVHNTNFNGIASDRGGIGGQVLNGAVFNAVTNAFIGLNNIGGMNGGSGTIASGVGGAGSSVGIFTGEFVPMAPVFVGVREDQLSRVTLLSRPDTTPINVDATHPDNVQGKPDEAGPNALPINYRLIAQVLTGQGPIQLPAGPGSVLFGNGLGGSTTGTGTGTGTTIGADPSGDVGTIVGTAKLNSSYLFPGLPAYYNDATSTATQTPIDYAVYLAADVGRAGISTKATSFPFNSAHANMTGVIPDYPSEFYGGSQAAQVLFGNGDAPITITTGSDMFENNFIIGEMDASGRIAAAYNSGPTILAGFNSSPASYVVVTDGSTAYTNKIGPIGSGTVPVVINDVEQTARGGWAQTNKFDLNTSMSIVDHGGIPVGLMVSQTLTNLASTSGTFNLRQVLDTNLFGHENPVYVVNDSVVQNSTTFSGSQIQGDIKFQTSVNDPVVTAFVALSDTGAGLPDQVTIGLLSELAKPIAAGGGANLRGFDTMSLDSGIALTWGNFTLQPGEKREMSFVVGFLPSGTVHDTWVPKPAVTATPIPTGTVTPTPTPGTTTVLTGLEDDPMGVTAVHVTPGQINDSIDIITNTGTAPTTLSPGGTAPTPTAGSATGALKFMRSEGAFPTNEDMTVYGAIADLDNDGYQDIVTANFGGISRVYHNELRISSDGSTSRYFRDITFGEDGIPNTPDDLFDKYYDHQNTSCVLVADFFGHGYPDIIFLNQNNNNDPTNATPDYDPTIQNRYYRNEGPNPVHAGRPPYSFYEDKSVLPGLLNYTYVPLYGRMDGGQDFQVPFPDKPSRATVGDIDSDGDLDIIISQFTPFKDDIQNQFPNFFLDGNLSVQGLPMGTQAWVDLDPRTPNFPLGDREMNTSQDFYTLPLYCAERVLINQVNQPGYSENWYPGRRGEFFVDETLGTDDRFGTLTSLEIRRSNDAWEHQYIDYQDFGGNAWNPTEIDRMPPVFPTMFNVNAFPTYTAGQTVTSPMGAHAVEPHLGSLFRSSALDLFSVRSFKAQSTDYMYVPYVVPNQHGGTGLPVFLPNPNVTYQDEVWRLMGFVGGNEQAYFRNLDLFGNDNSLGPDGIADGYFFCYNYNSDFGNQTGEDWFTAMVDRGPGIGTGYLTTGSGLFCFEPDRQDVDSSGTATPFRYDAFPLFIGMPEGHPAHYTPASGVESDIVPPIAQTAWAGIIGDFENRGYPRPFVASDLAQNAGGPMYLFHYDDSNISELLNGVARSQGASFEYGGVAAQYWNTFSYAYYGIMWPMPKIDWVTEHPLTAPQLGQPYGVAAGDFSRDGNQDLFIANSSIDGISRLNGSNQVVYEFGTNGAPKQLLQNDGFGNFTDVSTTGLLPLPQNLTHAMFCAAADIDNDGDLDLVVFNAGTPLEPAANELYINQAFTHAPNLLNTADPTMFYDASASFIPQLIGLGVMRDAYDPTHAPFSGINYRATVADLNSDGRPDLVFAEGGDLVQKGDWARVLINGGEPGAEGVPVFKPGGAGYPAPAVDMWKHYMPMSFLGDDPINAETSVFGINGFVGTRGHLMDVAAGDFLNNGSPDLLLAKDGEGPELLLNYHNNDKSMNSVPNPNSTLGDGIFTPFALPALIDPGSNGQSGIVLKNENKRVKLADVNGDGMLDIILANGANGPIPGGPNVLLLNTSNLTDPANPEVSFTDVTEKSFKTVFDENTNTSHGLIDDTVDIAVGNFNDHANGAVDIIFLNQSSSVAPYGLRYLINDGHGHFTDIEGTEPEATATVAGLPPQLLGRKPVGILVGDFDGLGEPTEDKNYNGFLDPGEDTNHNGVIDFTDLPDETVAGDVNGDGIITKRTAGVWDGSLDLLITFDDGPPMLLLNDPTGLRPGRFIDASDHLPATLDSTLHYRNADAGDFDLDGYQDIAIALYRGGIGRPALLLQNYIKTVDGKPRHGYFRDVSYELPYPRAEADFFELQAEKAGTIETDDTSLGWANDVKFLDVDGDGDLDLLVVGQGHTRNVLGGSPCLMYINRLIGDNWNARPNNGLLRSPGSPLVFSVIPRGSAPGTVETVEVIGANLVANPPSAQHAEDLSTMFSFGPGVTVLSVTPSTQANAVNVTIKVDANAALGPRAVMAQNPSGRATSTKVGMFNIFSTSLAPQYKNEIPNRVWAMYE